MNGITGLALTFGAAMVMAFAVACSDGDPNQQTDGPTPSPPSSPAAPVPRPADADELIAESQIIVIGTIGEEFEEKRIGAYGPDGQPTSQPSGGPEIWFWVTDFQLDIEEVIIGDETVSAGVGSIILRIHGRFSAQQSGGNSGLFKLPEPGDYLLFALGRNPDGTYGSGPGGLVDLESEYAMFEDGRPFASGVTTAELLEQIRTGAPK